MCLFCLHRGINPLPYTQRPRRCRRGRVTWPPPRLPHARCLHTVSVYLSIRPWPTLKPMFSSLVIFLPFSWRRKQQREDEQTLTTNIWQQQKKLLDSFLPPPCCQLTSRCTVWLRCVKTGRGLRLPSFSKVWEACYGCLSVDAHTGTDILP